MPVPPEESAIPKAIVLGAGTAEVQAAAPGQTLTYAVAMAAGEIFHLRIEQRGLDVEIHWPQDFPKVDLPYGKFVAEELWWHARVESELRFDVVVAAGQGDYRLVVEKLGPADEIDKLRAAAFWRQRRLGELESVPEEDLLSIVQAWQAAKVPVQEALAWTDIGRSRRIKHQLTAAADSLDTALELLSQTQEQTLRARIRLERGKLQQYQGHFDRAGEDLLAAAEALHQTRDFFGLAVAINDLAVARDIQGELAMACDGYQRAYRLFQQLDSLATVRTQLRLGRCYSKLGSLPEAPTTLFNALRASDLLPQAKDLKGEILREIGWWHRLEGRPKEALRFLNWALKTDPKTPGIMDRLGTVHLDLGELLLAREDYQRALRQLPATSLRAAHVQLNLCRLEEQSGRVEAGLKHCGTALEIFTRLDATGPAAQALLLSARLTRSRDLREAEALAEQALTSIERQRPRMGAPERRSAFLAERLDAHQLVIDLRMELNAREPGAGWDAAALQVSELTRTRSFLDLLKGREVKPNADSDSERTESTLYARIDAVSRSLDGSKPAGRERLDKLAELAMLEEQLAVHQERYAQVNALKSLAGSCPMDVESIQGLLDAETLLLVYHLGDRQSYLWKVHSAGVTGLSLGDRDRIEALAESWYQLLSNLETTPWTRDLERRRAHLLSNVLLAPIQDDLHHYRRFVIVADGVLLRIPFGALPTPEDAAGERPLLADYEVVSLPSVGVLAALRRQMAERKPAEGLLAVVADPVYSPTVGSAVSGGTAKTTPRPTVLEYPRLHGAADEAQTLLGLVTAAPTLLLDRFEARVDRVMDGALAGFRVVHFATHAETHDASDRPLGLILSRFNADGRPIEGLLGLRELYVLRLSAELVVLSACGTALGEELRGEGLIGLTRGFMHAGTPRVIVSLWEVQDQATHELMALFYRNLLHDQMAPAEALRHAQVEMWQAQWPPTVWGAFVLQGDWRPFPVTPDH